MRTSTGRAPLAAAGGLLLLALGTAGCAGTDSGTVPHGPPGASPGRRQLPAGGHLIVTTEGGVRLVGSAGHGVTVAGGTKADWSGEGATRTLDLPCGQADRDACSGVSVVHVPSDASVTVRARTAGVDVSDVHGSLDLTTVDGDVTVEDAGRSHGTDRLTTRNGSVRVVGLGGGRIEAQTVNGDVELACATSPTAVRGVTRNGSVRLALPATAPSYLTEATTVNGTATVEVPARGADGHRLTLRTVNGDVEAHRG
ncbi:DUF4097 family beta strand repeat-containing protein [Streptomyces sp. NPDC059740]|uniref:DUF4097 family beta strand repeat-containing protein n=1 Tax=Streptomyces sp. NPDC059740 TaxID=3346926 RepID=UPI00365C8E83